MDADGRDCLSVVMERETGRQTKGTVRGWERAEFEKAKNPPPPKTVAHRHPG